MHFLNFLHGEAINNVLRLNFFLSKTYTKNLCLEVQDWNINFICMSWSCPWQKIVNPGLKELLLVVKIPPWPPQSNIFTHRLTAAPSAPHVCGWVKQASLRLPRLIHCCRLRSKLTAEFIWKLLISKFAFLSYVKLIRHLVPFETKKKHSHLSRNHCTEVHGCISFHEH